MCDHLQTLGFGTCLCLFLVVGGVACGEGFGEPEPTGACEVNTHSSGTAYFWCNEDKTESDCVVGTYFEGATCKQLGYPYYCSESEQCEHPKCLKNPGTADWISNEECDPTEPPS